MSAYENAIYDDLRNKLAKGNPLTDSEQRVLSTLSILAQKEFDEYTEPWPHDEA